MNQIDIKEISEMGWIQRWAGSYTFISAAYWGYQYYQSLDRILGVRFDHTLFIHRQGTVAFYVRQDEFNKLGRYLADKAMSEPELAQQWLQELKNNTDVIVPLMEQLGSKIPSWDEYQRFLTSFDRHLAYHVFMKKTVDFLPAESLDDILPPFKDARLYSERVYSDTEQFFRNVSKNIAKKEKKNADHLTCLTQEELEAYLQSGVLPTDSVLQKRFTASALYFEDNQMNIILGTQVDELEKRIAAELMKDTSEIRGTTGYKGKAEGICRIILDPHKNNVFNDGDILVTGMTRPEFMPLIKKSSAIITDAGGILCHAAIVARELHKPCVTGTEIATKALKDGDRVRVDADNGIITKL